MAIRLDITADIRGIPDEIWDRLGGRPVREEKDEA